MGKWGLWVLMLLVARSAMGMDWGLQLVRPAGLKDLGVMAKPVLVAVIDTGVDISHPALKDKIWVNPGESGRDALGREKSRNRVDDDKNGYIDDLNGWDFIEERPILFDKNGHGTHIAGIISQTAPEAKIMVLKYYDPSLTGDETIATSVRAIRYAVMMGARIINYSAGGMEFSALEYAAVAQAEEREVLFVAAAGNEGLNSDRNQFYPAGYSLTNIISVGALGRDHQMLKSSNFGEESVDFVAPGENILSTLPAGRFGRLTGTSQATAFVTGAAAVWLGSQTSIYTPAQIKHHLAMSGSYEPNLIGKTKFMSRLNLLRAIAMRESRE